MFTPASIDTELAREVMGSMVDLSPEWWRRSSIFCMAVHDKLRRREWAITTVYNRAAETWCATPTDQAVMCGWVLVSLNWSKITDWVLRMGSNILVTHRHYILCTLQRPQTWYNTFWPKSTFLTINMQYWCHTAATLHCSASNSLSLFEVLQQCGK